jgi:hypothetical protein
MLGLVDVAGRVEDGKVGVGERLVLFVQIHGATIEPDTKLTAAH